MDSTKDARKHPELVHRDPIWRHRANFIIMAEFQDETTGLRREQLWARKLDENRFEICCIPFFLYDLSLGDEVETHANNDVQYVVSRVVRRSGHETFRVWFGENPSPTIKYDVQSDLVALGGGLEWSSKNLLAVDAADAELGRAVFSYLKQGHRRGDYLVEAGNESFLASIRHAEQ